MSSIKRIKEHRKKPTIVDLKKLGDDLVQAIQNAAWNDDVGSNNLSGPTYHMREAVSNWKEATR